jgi:hypothetical protein
MREEAMECQALSAFTPAPRRQIAAARRGGMAPMIAPA